MIRTTFCFKKNELIYSIIVVFLLFYIYHTTFQEEIFGNRAVGILCVLFACCIGIFFQIPKFKLSFGVQTFWFLLAILSIFNNQDLLNDTQSRWLLPMAGIATIIFLRNHENWQKTLVYAVKFFVLIHAFFTIFFYIFQGLYVNYFIKIIPGTHEYLLGKFYDGCMPGITSHYSTNGIYLGLGLVFFIVDAIVKPKKTINYYIKTYAGIFFVFIALLLTAKRAHIAFAVCATIIMYFVYNANKKISRWFYIIGAIIVLGCVFLAFAQFVPALANVLNRFLEADGGEITNGRIWFWEFAMEQFRENPVFGIGWGGFKHAYFDVIGPYASTSIYVDCHNVFLQILCEQGIVGFCLFVVATGGTLIGTWMLLKKLRVSRVTDIKQTEYILTLSLGIQTFFLLYCLTGNCLYDFEAFLIYILSCSLYYSARVMVRGAQYK